MMVTHETRPAQLQRRRMGRNRVRVFPRSENGPAPDRVAGDQSSPRDVRCARNRALVDGHGHQFHRVTLRG